MLRKLLLISSPKICLSNTYITQHCMVQLFLSLLELLQKFSCEILQRSRDIMCSYGVSNPYLLAAVSPYRRCCALRSTVGRSSYRHLGSDSPPETSLCRETLLVFTCSEEIGWRKYTQLLGFVGSDPQKEPVSLKH